MKPLAAVQAFDPLCEVQSDKASVEITSPFDGIVKELLVKEGEVAKVGENLCMIEVDEEAVEGESAEATPSKASTSKIEPLPAPETIRTDLQGEEMEAALEPPRRLHPLDPRAQTHPPKHLMSDPAEVLALPSVRHFAKQNRVDLALLVPGSGRGGRIEKRDVEAYLARGSTQATAPSHSKTSKQAETDVVVELNRTRHSMWKAMVKVRIFLTSLWVYATYLRSIQ